MTSDAPVPRWSLVGHADSWAGSNAFRLMPTDEPHRAPASATVSVAAGGLLAAVAYTWSHPQDGAQEGLLVVGTDEQPERAVALWGDSWHQSPASKSLSGTVDDGTVTVGYTYGGDWEWRIVLDATDPESLGLRMDNVVPASAAAGVHAAGAYWAMDARLRRSP